MKRLFVLTLLLVSVPALQAQQIVLPASGHLAGPLDYPSQGGDEFFNFPAFLGDMPPLIEEPFAGWVELSFGASFVEGGANKVMFSISYDGTGLGDLVTFGNGQQYFLSGGRAFPNPFFPNVGILNLDSGEVEFVTVNAVIINSLIAENNKLSRIPLGLLPFFPLPFALDPTIFPEVLEHGFQVTDAGFSYDPSGRITGFEFFGRTVQPIGLLGFLNPMLGLFPTFSFGPNGEFYFSNPNGCLDPAPMLCPTNAANPDGNPLALNGFLHPHLLLSSSDLREADPMTPPASEPVRRAHGVLVPVSPAIYHIGGVDGDGVVTGQVQFYDPASGAWVAGPPMPIAVTDAQGAAVAGRIYVVGGRTAVGGATVPSLQILDTATGVWSLGPEAPVPVAHGVAVAVDRKVYVLGGRTGDGSELSDAVECYDPATGAWNQLAVKVPILVEGMSAVATGEMIYLFGGAKTEAPDVQTVTDEVFVYNTIADEFRVGPPLLAGVVDAVAGIAANRIFLVGGRSQIGGPSTALTQTLALGDDAWAAVDGAPFPVANAGGAALNGEIYVAGGRSMGLSDAFPGVATSALQVFNPGQGWVVSDSQPLFNSNDLLNSAALTVVPRPLSPGSLAVLTGHNFGGPDGAPPGEHVPTVLGGLSITVDGIPAPILGVTPQRVDFQIPYGVAPGAAAFEVHKAGSPQQAPPLLIPIEDTGVGLFAESFGITHVPPFLDRASALACNADGGLNYSRDSVDRGEVITLRATGLGPVSPPLANGQRAGAGVTADLPVSVSIDGLPAVVQSTTATEGEVGLFDVRAVVPAGARTGMRIPVEITVDGLTSNQAGLAIEIDSGMPSLEPCRTPIAVPPPAVTCTPSDTTLCLGDERFQVEVGWRNASDDTGSGHAVEINGTTGYFWFYDEENVEVVIKVLDACIDPFDHFWVFAAGLTDVEVELTVTDTVTGDSRVYDNPLGTLFQPIQSTDAFATCDAGKSMALEDRSRWDISELEQLFAKVNPHGPSELWPGSDVVRRLFQKQGSCVPDATTLCLGGDRFRVETFWETPGGETGEGRAATLTGVSGTFWFFSPDNIEVVVKVLDACGLDPFNSFWVFGAGLTDVGVTLRVTDTVSGEMREYSNPVGTPFQPVFDASSFTSCP